MRVTRRNVLLGAGSIGAALATPGRMLGAPEIVLKYSTNVPMSNPLNIRLAETFNRIREETGGRVEIQLYPDSQLGTDSDLLSQLRSGAIDFFSLSGVILSTLIPLAAINGVGFAFLSYDQVWKAMDGDLGHRIRAEISKVNIVAMDRIWNGGYRQMTSSGKQIRAVADLKGFKVRVPPGPLWISMFTALEASPTTINFSETYSALQTRMVDGTEVPLVTIVTSKLYEVQKYVSLTKHMWDGYWSLANRKMWEGLPSDMRQIIAANINQAALDQRTDVIDFESTAQAELKAKGIEIIDVDGNAFRAKLQMAGFYRDWKAKFGDEAWSLLERVTGPIS